MLRPRETIELVYAEQLANVTRTLRLESQSILEASDRINAGVVEAAEIIESASGCVIVTGMGKAGIIAQKIAATMASTGTTAHYLHPADATHGDLGRVGAGDVVLALSHSGETSEITQIISPVLDQGACLIALTSSPQSKLGRSARLTLAYGPIEEACPLGLAPSSSCAVMMAAGDALAFLLMARRGFEAEDFGRFHPSGSLGRRFQKVEEMMRRGRQLRIASCDLSVREAFSAVHQPGRRSGAICLVDAHGRLAGLFTDSDLAKLFEGSDLGSLDRPIREIMTQHPITLQVGCLVSEAVALLKRHQVSEIPVLDTVERPVGMVDVTDVYDLLPEAA